ncbi:hypothetical protein FMEXI_10208 [Fusarium mexicanum]|uniref:Uncharacterized protein n=1 Tax=Fusarium mexicanum TaxID=751941 RepID=A0A8H5IHH3_9HYPO|nr:hypothetical protein FMEXI_10208 [Fusarium mexicanum]
MATPADKSYEPLSIPGNHVTMCKFDSSDEPGYIMIKWLLRKWIKELPEHKSGGPANPAEPSIGTNATALDTPAELRILHELLGLSKEDAASTSEYSKEQSKPLLSPETVRWLASKELLSSIQQKSLTISTAPLLESFTTTSTNPPSTGGNWSLSEDDKPFLRKVDVPIRLYSAETYEFLGYQRSVAERLWNSLSSSKNPSFSLFDVSKERLEVDPPAKSEYGWNNFMNKIGICESLRNSILHSHLDNIRSTASCEFWLRTAFEIRWQELKALDGDVLKAMKRTASTGEQRTGSSAPSQDHGTNTEQSESSGHQDTAPPTEQHSGEHEEKGPVTETTPATQTADPDAEVVALWRGGSKKNIENAKKEGRLCLQDIRSIPGDFSGTSLVPYFANRRDTAVLYGAFHAELSETGIPPYLLQFKVGKKWLETLQHRCLWATGDENNACNLGMPNCPDQENQGVTGGTEDRSWEHVVFECRKKKTTPSFIRKQDLVIGHIAKFHNEEFEKMGAKTDAGAAKLIVNGTPAVQYVFISEDSQDQLVEEASDVQTECLTGMIVRRCRNDCTGKPRVDDVRLIDLCQACKDKWDFGSE